MDRLPPLNPLRAFEATGRLKSIRKAASELSVTPGAISRQVQTLEENLGVSLFERSPGAITLTTRGELYLGEVSASLDVIRQATRKLTGRKAREALKIRAYTTIAMKWLIPRLSSFHSANKNTEVFIMTSTADVDFAREDIDGAIRLGDGNWPGYEVDALIANVVIPVCSPAFRKQKHLEKNDDLAGQTLLHSLARPDDWAHWLEAAGLTGIDPYAGPKYESSVLAYQAAIEGQGVAVAPKVFVAEDMRKRRLIQPFGPAVDRANFTYYLIYPRNRLRSRAFREFRSWLLSEGQS
jgi:LysR family glycine cleavage system transcriptional activator